MHQVPYDGYAELYDRSGQARFSLRMVTYARNCGNGGPGGVLACGTGAAVALPAGYEVTG
jgi:hypothetical protein